MQTPFIILLILIFILSIGFLVTRSRMQKQPVDWSPEQAQPAIIDWHSPQQHTIQYIRNNLYRTPHDFDTRHITRTFNLTELRNLYYVVEPFSFLPGTAHTFLSFGFENGETFSISVEARRKANESFSLLRGLTRTYRLIYIIGTEQDVVGLRVRHRNHVVCRYPVRIEPEALQQLWTSMLKRAHQLNEQPEYYHTLFNSCIMNIIRHLNEQLQVEIKSSWPILLPGYSDRYAYKRGWLDTDLPFKKARKAFRLSPDAFPVDQ